jgi:hypothetical protein
MVQGGKKHYTVQTLYHHAKIPFFALQGDRAHEKFISILRVQGCEK